MNTDGFLSTVLVLTSLEFFILDEKSFLKEPIECTTCGKDLRKPIVNDGKLDIHPALDVLICQVSFCPVWSNVLKLIILISYDSWSRNVKNFIVTAISPSTKTAVINTVVGVDKEVTCTAAVLVQLLYVLYVCTSVFS